MRQNQCCVILIGLLIFSFVLIPINIIEEEKEEEEEEEEEMKLFQFKYQTDSENNKKPQNTHLVVETELGYLYMVDSSDNTLIIKSEDKGVNWVTIVNQSYNIISLLIDRDNDRLYYVFWDTGANQAKTRYIDLTNDSDNADFSKGEAGNSRRVEDLFISGTTGLYTTITVDTGTWDARIRRLLGAASNSIFLETGLGADPFNDIALTYITSDGTFHWMLYQSSTDHVFILKNNIASGTFTNMEDFGSDQNIPSNSNYHAIAYDGEDKLYFVIYDLGDSKNYLWDYSIGDDVAERLGEFDIAIMLDRNNDNSGDTPNNIEKAFVVGGTKIYKFSRLKSGVILIQDIANDPDFTVSSTILAITDNFLFVDNSGTIEIWEQTEVLSEFITRGRVDRKIQEFSKAEIKGNITFTSNQIIEIYDDDTTVR